MVPVFVASCWEESLLESDDLVGASGYDSTNDELAVGGEEVGELGRVCWDFCGSIESTERTIISSW